MPFISFCLSTYKRPTVLKETLMSIQRQSFEDFEVIVSDNDIENSGKTAIAELNDSRFKYFSNAGNIGMKASFNKSLERSSGEYIVMIADDDPIYFDMALTLVKLRSQFPGYGMYMGGCDWLCSDPKISKLYKLKIGTNSCLSNKFNLGYTKSFDNQQFLKAFFNFDFFPHYLWSTTMVRKDIITQMGGIPDYGTPFLGDYAYLSVMGSSAGCTIINKSLGCQTLHSENFGRNQNEQLIIAAKNFPVYLSKKMNHLKEWHEIEKLIFKFTSLWVFSHLSFLYKFFDNKQRKQFKKVESEIFKIDYLKKIYPKYFLNTRIPFLHKQIVFLKKSFSSTI